MSKKKRLKKLYGKCRNRFEDTADNEMSVEIDKRMPTGWERFSQCNTFLKDKKIPICLRRQTMDTIILPMTCGYSHTATTYGVEIAREQFKKLPREAWTDQC